MKRLLMAISLGFTMLVGACSSSSGPPKIVSITLARDDGSGKAGAAVTSFAPTDHVFYATIKLDSIATGLTVKTTWVAVDAGGATNKEITSKEFSSLVANEVDASVSLPNDWPTGKYRLDVYLNGTLAQSVDFTVA